MTLHQREASLIRYETVVQRASCCFQHTAGFRVARACSILPWLSLGRWQNTRAYRACAPCYDGCDQLPLVREYRTGGRSLSFGARPWCDVRAVTSNAQPVFSWHARKPHYAGCLSGGGKTRELASRVRRAALAAVGLRTLEGKAPAEGPLFRRKTVVRRASCGLQHAAGFRMTDARAPLRWLSLEWRQNTQA